MTTVMVYVAFDGTRFDEEDECLSYEKEKSEEIELRKHIEAIRNYCSKRNCEECPYHLDDEIFPCFFPSALPNKWC
jgi:hypothetical protein